MTEPRRFPRRKDHGFTLTEMVIVTAMLGLLTASLAAIFTVVVRTTPDAEDRVDDARSIQGLVTWLPQDIDATPPDGFNRQPGFWPCGGTAPVGSNNVLSMRWAEITDTTTWFAASYRFETAGAKNVMTRATCTPGGPASVINLTSELSSTAPSIEMCATQLNAATGACDSVIPSADTTTPVLAVKVEITHPDGGQSTIDAASKNPDENLANDPNAVTRFPPQANVLSFPASIAAGTSAVFDLSSISAHGITDPDSTLAQLSVAVDSFEVVPTGLTVTTADPLIVTIASDPAGPVGGPNPVHLIVSDEVGNYIKVRIQVTVTGSPNLAPIVNRPSYHLRIEPGETVILPIDLSNDVSDPNNDPMAVSIVSAPVLLSAPLTGTVGLGPMEMELSAPASAVPSTFEPPIELQVSDGRGGTATASVRVEYVAAGTNAAPTVSTPNVDVSMAAGETVIVDVADLAPAGHGLSDANGDLVIARIDGAAAAPIDITTTTYGTKVTIRSDIWIAAGPASSPISLLLTDIHGASVAATISVTITPPPPPASDCKLLSLDTSHPTGVNRVSGGAAAKLLANSVTVTLTYSGTCNGLTLGYDSGHPSGLGDTGRVFPTGGSPTSVVIYGDTAAGTEKFTTGSKVLTASTTSAVVAPATSTITQTLNVN